MPTDPSSPAPAWPKYFRLYDRHSLTSHELSSQLFDHVLQTPADYDVILEALWSHNDDHIRTSFANNFARLVETHRKVIDYSVEVLPLEVKLGCRVQISGGYTAAYEPNQPWLAGRPCHEGRLYGDAKIDSHHFPAAVVRLDYDLELPTAGATTFRGRFLLLYPRYQDHSWSRPEGVAHTYLLDSPPKDPSWFANRNHLEIESHATYRFLDD